MDIPQPALDWLDVEKKAKILFLYILIVKPDSR